MHGGHPLGRHGARSGVVPIGSAKLGSLSPLQLAIASPPHAGPLAPPDISPRLNAPVENAPAEAADASRAMRVWERAEEFIFWRKVGIGPAAERKSGLTV